MKTYKITISGKEIEVTQNEDGSFNKPDIVKELEPIGTALKPAFEPICMAMKPLSEKNYVANVLKYGTGGINIDESRVGTGDDRTQGGIGGHKTQYVGGELEQKVERSTGARFPANLIHDNSEEVRECFPETKTGKSANRGLQHSGRHGGLADIGGNIKDGTDTVRGHDDNGGNASRFFKSIVYKAKASKSERNKGCDGLEEGEVIRQGLAGEHNNPTHKNNHPTVKPIALMEYLIKMVTPKGGTVLDPFTGSGSTGVAAKQNGYGFIGIELNAEYIKIAQERINNTI